MFFKPKRTPIFFLPGSTLVSFRSKEETECNSFPTENFQPAHQTLCGFNVHVELLLSYEDVALPRVVVGLLRRARNDVEDGGTVLGDAQVKVAAVALGPLLHHGLHAVLSG